MRFDRFKEKDMYDVADVWNGFRYWFDKLLAYCLNIFTYEGLPDTLPAKEIESNLILTGHAVVFRPRTTKDIYTCYTSLTGFDSYYNPTYATYTQPRLGSGMVALPNAKEKTTGAIIYNCDLQNSVLGGEIDGSLRTFISRYARQLADIESTQNMKFVNERVPFIASADDDNVVSSVRKFFRSVILGKREIITDSSILPNMKTTDLISAHSGEKLTDLAIARDKILEQFYREIGVRFYQSKKAQVNTEEVTANNDMLLISLDDLLHAREEGIYEVNKLFGLSIKVDINESFKGGMNDVDTNNNAGRVEQDSDRNDSMSVRGIGTEDSVSSDE